MFKNAHKKTSTIDMTLKLYKEFDLDANLMIVVSVGVNWVITRDQCMGQLQNKIKNTRDNQKCVPFFFIIKKSEFE